ncbi:MAG TPA: ABC transporter permease [Bacteroidales bacterium]|nr:ABC transporter permease [Bacteroidales bacterium]
MYLKQFFRSLSRDLFNTAVMIISLITGVFCSVMILAFILHELGTDNFHEDKDRIFALKCDDPWVKDGKMYYCKAGSAEYMKKNYSSVEDYCRISNSNALKIVVNNQSYFDKSQLIGASQNFFNFFSYDLLTNNAETVLESKNSLVISTDLAEKYFNADALGKIVSLVYADTTENMVVTGVFRKSTENTQLVFDMVRQIGDKDSRCYVKLTPGSDPNGVEKIFDEDRNNIPVVHMGNPGAYFLEPFKTAYFDTSRATVADRNRDINDLLIAGIIGFLIFGVAVFNYLGILANRFNRKIREFFIRRINGGTVKDLAYRFFLENSIVVCLGFMLAILIIPDILPFFNSLVSSQVTGKFIFQADQLLIFASLLLIILIVSLLFIVYLISSNSNLVSLKTDYSYKWKSFNIPFFNIFQITASIVLIICSMVIMRQISYITEKPIGIDKNVIEVKIPAQHSKMAGVFKDELLKFSSVRNVSVVGASPLLEHMLVGLKYMQDGIEKEYVPSGFNGDENYIDVLNLKLIDGTGFNERTNGTKVCIINQSFARLFPDRKLIGEGMPGLEENIITGIVEDFHYSGFKEGIGPAFVSFSDKGGHLLVKATSGNDQEARKAIDEVWHQLIPDFPVNMESTGERLEWFHRNDMNFRRLIVSCSLISLFLSILGLLAVTYQKARARTKEIGIRKINGATLNDILFLINKGFLKWTTIAFLIATPLSWIAMHRWLQGFTYKTNFPWWIFVMAGVLTLIISMITVNWQIFTIARKNPVESLRYE